MALSNRKDREFVHPKLQITSMMDMFTIILIFLLFSFSSEPEADVKLGKQFRLPHSNSQQSYQKNVKLILSQTDLKLEDEVVAKVENGKVIGLDQNKLERSELYHKLKACRDKADIEKKTQKDKNEETIEEHLLFFCDKRISFKIINQIIKTAGMAGYPNLQFAVLKE